MPVPKPIPMTAEEVATHVINTRGYLVLNSVILRKKGDVVTFWEGATRQPLIVIEETTVEDYLQQIAVIDQLHPPEYPDVELKPHKYNYRVATD